MPGTSPEMLLSLVPEIGLLILAAILLVITLLKRENLNTHLDWISGVGLALVAVATFIFARPQGDPVLVWGEMIRFDRAGYFFSLLVLAGGALTAVFAGNDPSIARKPEFYLLMVLSSIGLVLMTTAGNIIMLYLAIETATIPLYVLAGIRYRDEKSVESGIKYFLFGGISSAIMLYGFSLLYGFAGTTKLYGLIQTITANQVPLPGLILAAILVLAGLIFKISAVPFHFWAPDVYEGAPTPVAGFLSTVSKAAGFAALIRIIVNAFGVATTDSWMIIIAIIATASMFLGNLLAIPQKNLKRLIAYSSIAHAGYILVGVATGTDFGFTAALYYLMAYLVTNLAVFAIINWVEKESGSTDISAFAGLNRRSPGLSLLLMISLLSLGGIPPLGGFISKVLVFGAAIQEGMIWLAVLGIINSVIGLYYYLRVMKVLYVDAPASSSKFARFPVRWSIALGVCIVGIIVLGIVYTPWFNFISTAATGF